MINLSNQLEEIKESDEYALSSKKNKKSREAERYANQVYIRQKQIKNVTLYIEL